MITPARGCYNRCLFCVAKSYHGAKLRRRSVDSVIQELEWAGQEFDIRDFLFWTESFTLDRNFVVALCEKMIERNLGVRWVCNSRVDDVDREMLKSMKRAGCWMVGYGIESRSQEILNNIGKGVTVEQIREACKMTRDLGIEVAGHLVFGLPGETRETVEETIRFAKELQLDYASFYCATPWPGTRLYEDAKEKGWLRQDAPWSMYEQNTCILDIGNMKAEEITKAREDAFRSFYLDYRTIYRTIRKIKSFSHLKDFLRMLRTFLVWIKGKGRETK